MSVASALGLWLAAQLSLSETLLGDAILASINQCRALHAEQSVLSLSVLRRVDRSQEGGVSSWQLWDASGHLVAGIDRKQVPVDSGPSVSDPDRLAGLRRATAEWTIGAAMEPRMKDRRGNSFAWVGRKDGALRCLFYRPELDQLERVWLSTQILAPESRSIARE